MLLGALFVLLCSLFVCAAVLRPWLHLLAVIRHRSHHTLLPAEMGLKLFITGILQFISPGFNGQARSHDSVLAAALGRLLLLRVKAGIHQTLHSLPCLSRL